MWHYGYGKPKDQCPPFKKLAPNQAVASDSPSSDMVLRVNPRAHTAMKDATMSPGPAGSFITSRATGVRSADLIGVHRGTPVSLFVC